MGPRPDRRKVSRTTRIRDSAADRVDLPDLGRLPRWPGACPRPFRLDDAGGYPDWRRPKRHDRPDHAAVAGVERRPGPRRLQQGRRAGARAWGISRALGIWRLDDRVAQPSHETAEARQALAAAAPLRLELLEAHDVVDAALEEAARLVQLLAVVVEEHQHRGRVERGEDAALAVMVEVGRDVAGEPPHPVGRAPREPGGGHRILRQSEDREGAAERFLVRIDHLDPIEDEFADPLADLERLHPFGRPGG